MIEHIAFHDCPKSVKDDIHAYWEQKRPRVERLLKRTPPDQCHLRLNIWRKPPRYEVRAVLLLPTGTLVAEDMHGSPRAALDKVADQLVLELRRHRDALRKDEVQRRKRVRTQEFMDAAEILGRRVEESARPDFVEFLRPLLRRIRGHAYHELILAQLEGHVRPGELTLSDLLDEVALRAWERYAERDTAEPLDQWVVRALHEVLDERQQREAYTLASDPEIAVNDVRLEAEDGWITENEPYWGEHESLTIDELLPDHDAPEPWTKLLVKEQRQQLFTYLRRLVPTQRRAFMLHVLDGWDAEEVGMLQNRSAEEVRNDIKLARDALRTWIARDMDEESAMRFEHSGAQHE